MKEFDTIIIGAGACGLLAGRELSRAGYKVAIIEAHNRTGGRIHTFTPPKFTIPIEAGAEFVHGQLPETLKLLKEYEIGYEAVTGEMWRTHNGALTSDSHQVPGFELLDKYLDGLKEDITVQQFLQTYFAADEYAQLRQAVSGFIEGFDTADPLTASAFKFRDEWQEFEKDEKQYRVEGGYIRLTEALESDCLKTGCILHLNTAATEVRWTKDYVQVVDENLKFYTAGKLLVTLPLGVLQMEGKAKGAIQFLPHIPEKINAANELGYGGIIKILLEFTDVFWETPRFEKRTGIPLKNMSFLFADTEIPTWWTQLPEHKPLLTGWLGGPQARELKNEDTETIFKLAIKSLAEALGEREKFLTGQLKAWHVANWTSDPFIRGSYSYATVGAEKHIDILLQPVEDTLFFAGEGLHKGDDTGTVEAALASGLLASKKMIEALHLQPTDK